MFALLPRWTRRLRRPAGLGLAAGLAVAFFGGLFWYEVGGSRLLSSLFGGRIFSSRPGEVLLLRGEMLAGNILRREGRPAALRSDMVFLGVDDPSLSLDGLWPDEIENSRALKLISEGKGAWNWSREVHALLLDRLVAAGARLVIFDMVFPNPNAGDESFRAALDRCHDRVLIGSQIVGDPPRSTFQQPTAALVADPAHDPRVGYVSYEPEFDGVIRRLTFSTTQEAYNQPDRPPQPTDTVYPSLVANALRQLGRADLIPADGRPRLFRYTDIFHGSQYLPRPLWEVFSDATWKGNYQDGAFFKDKIVIVGAAAPSLHDVQPTPYGEIPGPELHLQALTAALSREYLSQDYLTQTVRWTDFAMIVAAGALAWGLGLAVQTPLARLAAFLLVSAGFCGALQWLYNHHGLMPLALIPLLVYNVGGLGGLLGEYAVERVEKARVRGVLDRLVSKDIVRELLSDRERYDQLVRGHRQAVTVLFSDVRGFSTLSEAATDPAAFVAQLNEYLAEMVEVVFKHQGTLDKFIGDAVMAVWGSMHTGGMDTDARQAVAAALEMRERLAALNARWAAEGRLQIAIGIGLNHGEVIVGGLGSEQTKMEITVMGDAVNTASRLEGLTKEYGLDLLIGESVASRVSDAFRLRTVDLVRVKGKTKPTEVLTVLGSLDASLPSESHEQMLADYEDAILLFRRREFAAAGRRLEECLQSEPEDRLSLLYLGRCQELLAAAPSEEWDGVRLMTTK